MSYTEVEYARSKGYPYKIIGNDGYKATLTGIQRLLGHDFIGVYRYPGGECCHDLESIKAHFTIVEN